MKKDETYWWISGDPYEERLAVRQQQIKEENSPKRFPVKCCPECNKAYETQRQTTGDIIKLGRYYLDDFPTYGLERQKCYKCKGEVAYEEVTT
tara:strand:+ start:1283 stop:1561 length:279 start_codon:yes stop_codon:yes gene_type:complete